MPLPLCFALARVPFLQDNTVLTHSARRACTHCRLTGRTMFSIHLMAKQGRLVDVPHKMTSGIITVKQLADHLEPILTAAAGGSLDAYRL